MTRAKDEGKIGFYFTEEDFKRYVKVGEHGGRHIWHELLERLQREFEMPFSVVSFEVHGDWLRTLWFAPKNTPRSKWGHQAQFYLARSIEDKRLDFGLTIERPTMAVVEEEGCDRDLDSVRFVAHLQDDDRFRRDLEWLVREEAFELWACAWGERGQLADNADDMVDLLQSFPPEKGWDAYIGRRMAMPQVLSAADTIADRIMDAYRLLRPLWEAVIPEAAREFVRTGIVSPSSRIWKISPGEGAKYWSTFCDRSVIAVGFAVDLDISQYSSKDELKDAVSEAEQVGLPGYAAGQLWTFVREMRVGDTVVAYGNAQVLGIGEITGEYEYHADSQGFYAHRRAVRWDDLTVRPTADFSPELRTYLTTRVTILELTPDQLAEIRGGRSAHILFRIAWRPNGWCGGICSDPVGNEACKRFGYIKEKREEGDCTPERFYCGDEHAAFSEWWVRIHEGRQPQQLQAGDSLVFLLSHNPKRDGKLHYVGFYTLKSITEDEEGKRCVVNGAPSRSAAFDPDLLELRDDEYNVRDWRSLSFRYRGNDVAVRILKRALDAHQRKVSEVPSEEKKRWQEVVERIRMALEDLEPDSEPIGYMQRYFAAKGFHFTPHQLATFYTALKTKGFVILSGLSGTGKTKLAQLFAELMSSLEAETAKEPRGKSQFVPVRPDWRDSKSLLGYYNPLSGQFESTEFLRFLLRACDNYLSSLHELKWEADHPNAGTLLAEPKAFATDRIRLGLLAFDADGRIIAQEAFEFRVNEGRQLSLRGRMSDLEPFRNVAKIYALELDRVYSHFIILDEMNLARVEYYFADFLSVLESGRGDDGWTQEAIALHDFRSPIENADGNPIPPQIKLPPNLYFVGTVNVDETTHMFSPKVLDRAFTIEFTEVDFTKYPAEESTGLLNEELEELRQQLLEDFTRGGRFATIDKGAISEFVVAHPEYRQHLQNLNALFQSYNLHFAYRVFDEIMAFLANAESSPVFAGFDDLYDAFDTSVLMKVLPKFHGPRGKLEKPLQALLAWALQPGNPDEGWTKLKPRLDDETKKWTRWQESLETEGLEPFLAELGFAYERTARKALRMLRSLYTTGFASFA